MRENIMISGSELYIQHLIREYASMQHPRDFLLFIAPEDAKTVVFPEGVKTVITPYRKYSLGEILSFGRQINDTKVSVFHSPHYTLPIGLKSKSIVTIHDLIHLRFPQFFSLLQRSYSYGMIWHAIHDSCFIITDSEFTKLDILRSFHVREEKIIPIHLGVSEQFHRRAAPSLVMDFKLNFKLDTPTFFSLGIPSLTKASMSSCAPLKKSSLCFRKLIWFLLVELPSPKNRCRR